MSDSSTSIFALTTRGLEDISAAEMAALSGVSVTETAYRRVAAACDGPLEPLLDLRTVDDVFLDVAMWNNLPHTRDALATIRAWSEQLALYEARAIIAGLRPVGSPPLVAVTASFVGRRSYSSDEIKMAVGEAIARRHRWTTTDDDAAADLSLRLFIEHETAHLGLRLAKTPLHRRAYKRVHRPGSLKPPVAAAMLALADVRPGDCLLDPFCGMGTIAIEGMLQGATAAGFDRDDVAVSGAQRNAAAAGVDVDLRVGDACALPLPDGSIDRVVSNLPWGRQVTVDQVLQALYQEAAAEMQRVLASGGRIALLTSHPELLPTDMPLIQQREISLFGQTPVILVFGRTSR